MDPDQAKKAARSGELIGRGCEAHEAKFNAKKDKLKDKRKARAQYRRYVKESQVAAGEKRKRVEVGIDVDEEERFAGGT